MLIFDPMRDPSAHIKAQSTQDVRILYFSSPSCGPCKAMESVLREYDAPFAVAKINADNENDMVAAFNVQAVPTVIFLRHGKEIRRVTAIPSKKMLDEILKMEVKSK